MLTYLRAQCLVQYICDLFNLCYQYSRYNGPNDKWVNQGLGPKSYHQWVARPELEPTPVWFQHLDLNHNAALLHHLASLLLKSTLPNLRKYSNHYQHIFKEGNLIKSLFIKWPLYLSFYFSFLSRFLQAWPPHVTISLPVTPQCRADYTSEVTCGRSPPPSGKSSS